MGLAVSRVILGTMRGFNACLSLAWSDKRSASRAACSKLCVFVQRAVLAGSHASR